VIESLGVPVEKSDDVELGHDGGDGKLGFIAIDIEHGQPVANAEVVRKRCRRRRRSPLIRPAIFRVLEPDVPVLAEWGPLKG
tara:strand:+ start:778 stop:1023 length:246 start_codon:yes stop_codon:yes gene_type:complete